MKKVGLAGLSVLIGATSLMAGVGTAFGAVKTTAAKPIVVGTTPLVSSTPLFLAEGLGYWKKLGLNVQLQTFSAAGTIDVATAANSLDVSATGITAGLFNLWNSGKKEYIVADKGRIWPGQHFEALVVSNKAWNAGVRSIKALKGKRFGNTSTGSTFDYLLGSMLEKNGLTIKDIQDVPLTQLKNMTSAVETGQVDATILPQPAANQALASGKVHLLAWVDNQVKADLLVIAFSPQFVQQKADAVKFLEGYVEAVRYYTQHVYRNHNMKDPYLKKALSIIAHYTGTTPAEIPSELIYVNPNGYVDPANIQNQLNFYTKNQFVSGNVSVTQMVNESFLQQAIAALKKAK